MAGVRLLWDASGFVKRYYGEAGQATVNAIFSAVPLSEMHITPWGYAETYSILLRRRNSGSLNANAFRDAVTELQQDVLGNPSITLLTVSDAIIFGSLSLMQAHNINSADAVILATYLRFQRTSREACLLVASDRRLLRAARMEGLNGLNPEEVAAGDVPGWVV